jgi:hypothetical protein
MHDVSAMTEARCAPAHARHHPLTLPPRRGRVPPSPASMRERGLVTTTRDSRGNCRNDACGGGFCFPSRGVVEHLPAGMPIPFGPGARARKHDRSIYKKPLRRRRIPHPIVAANSVGVRARGHRSSRAGGSLPAARRSAVALSLGVSPRGSVELWCCGLRYARSAAVQPTRRNLGAAQK